MSFGGNSSKLPKTAPTLLGLDAAQSSTSQENRPVPLFWGTPKSLGATQMTQRFDVYHKTKESKKGGGETRTYFASWAGLIGQGPLTNVLRIISNKAEAWPLGGTPLPREMKKVFLVRGVVTAGGHNYSANTTVAGSNGATFRPIIRSGVLVDVIVLDQGQPKHDLAGALDQTVADPTITVSDTVGTGATVVPVLDSETFRIIEVKGGGTLIFYWGSDNQDFDAHLISLSADTQRNPAGPRVGNALEEHPAYVNQAYFVAVNWNLGTNATQIPNLEFVCSRFPVVDYIHDLAGLGTDANPVTLLAELVENGQFGLGRSDVVNQDNFDEVADLIAAEGWGVSPVLTSAEEFYQFTAKLLEYFNGFVTTGPDGKLMLGLVRETPCNLSAVRPVTLVKYDPSTPYFDESTLTEPPVLDPAAWDDTKNQVVVGFSNGDLNSKVQSAIGTSRENFLRTGEPRQETLDRPWFTKLGLADIYARASAQILGTPRLSGTLKVRESKLGGLDVGGIFRLTWADLGLCFLQARVNELRWQNPYVREVTVVWEVDRAYLTGQVIATPVYHVPVPAVHVPVSPDWQIVELPYTTETKTEPFLALLVARMDSLTSAYRVFWVGATAGEDLNVKQSSAFCYAGSLTMTVTKATDTPISIVTMDADKKLPHLFGLDTSLGEWLVFIGDEIMAVEQIQVVDEGANSYRLWVAREQFDTARGLHNTGTEFYLVERAVLQRTAFKTGKPSTAGTVTTLEMQSATLGTWFEPPTYTPPQKSITWTDRAKRWWKPRNLRLNGVIWYVTDPILWTADTNLALTWDAVNRNGFGAVWDPGMTSLWGLEVYDVGTGVTTVTRYASDKTGTTIDGPARALRIRLWAAQGPPGARVDSRTMEEVNVVAFLPYPRALPGQFVIYNDRNETVDTTRMNFWSQEFPGFSLAGMGVPDLPATLAPGAYYASTADYSAFYAIRVDLDSVARFFGRLTTGANVFLHDIYRIVSQSSLRGNPTDRWRIVSTTALTETAAMIPSPGRDAPVTLGLRGWWKADYLTGFTDTDPVDNWADASGLGIDFLGGGTSADWPIYRTNQVNGLPALTFDNQNLQTGTALHLELFTGAQIFAVLKVEDDSRGGGLWNFGSNGRTIFRASGTIETNFCRNGAVTTVDPSLPMTIWRLYSEMMAGGNLTTWLDGTQLFTVAGQSYVPGASGVLGQDAGGVVYLLGSIAEILIYTRELNPTERGLVEDYLATKYGLVLRGVGGTIASHTTVTGTATVIAGGGSYPPATPGQYVIGNDTGTTYNHTRLTAYYQSSSGGSWSPMGGSTPPSDLAPGAYWTSTVDYYFAYAVEIRQDGVSIFSGRINTTGANILLV